MSIYRHLAVIAAACLPAAVLAQGNAPDPRSGPSTPVTIVNPIPLPVTGNVNIVNPSPLPVTGNVNVNGSVTVAAQEPFQKGTPFTGFQGDGGTTALIVVPAGKRLVIEGVSAHINSFGTGGVSSVSISVSTDRANELVCHPAGETGNGLNHFFQCSTQVKFYAGPLETVNFSAGVVSNQGGFYRVYASGYYVTVP